MSSPEQTIRKTTGEAVDILRTTAKHPVERAVDIAVLELMRLEKLPAFLRVVLASRCAQAQIREEERLHRSAQGGMV